MGEAGSAGPSQLDDMDTKPIAEVDGSGATALSEDRSGVLLDQSGEGGEHGNDEESQLVSNHPLLQKREAHRKRRWLKSRGLSPATVAAAVVLILAAFFFYVYTLSAPLFEGPPALPVDDPRADAGDTAGEVSRQAETTAESANADSKEVVPSSEGVGRGGAAESAGKEGSEEVEQSPEPRTNFDSKQTEDRRDSQGVAGEAGGLETELEDSEASKEARPDAEANVSSGRETSPETSFVPQPTTPPMAAPFTVSFAQGSDDVDVPTNETSRDEASVTVPEALKDETAGDKLSTDAAPAATSPEPSLSDALSPNFAPPPAGTEAGEVPAWILEHFLDDPEEATNRKTLSDGCDLWDGRWVYDESYPLWDWKACPFGDDGFNCASMGRKDLSYMKLRWQPHDCNLPRFDAADFRRRMEGRRLALVGDSLGRNQFVSLLCMAAHGANTSRIYEASGGRISKEQQSVVFVFEEHNFTLEYYRSPWLVQHTRAPKDAPPEVLQLLAVDTPDWRWPDSCATADIVVFNLGHWIIKDKTVAKGTYFSVNHTIMPDMGAEEAFDAIMHTVARWVEGLKSPAPDVFFRGYAPVHFQLGEWNTGGRCVDLMPKWNESEVQELYFTPLAEKAIAEMRHPMTFLDIMRLSALRNDAHIGKTNGSEIYDCSHWCVPGVPDIWNELFYATLLARGKPPFD